MHQRAAESRLALAYTLCFVGGATASITAGIAWGHWKDTLNECGSNLDYRNCSCIFYGRHTPRHFLGGDTASCIWITFGPLIYILLAVGLACFHGFRVLFGAKTTTTRSVSTKNTAGETVILQAIEQSDTKPLPKAYWIFALILSGLLLIYSFIHFIFYVDGTMKTCREYRQTLINQLGAHGTILPVIYGRLSCNAIFDFMDFIQPNAGNAYRDGFINTAADLIIGIIASLLGWFALLCAFAINVRFVRIRRNT